jgi:hypothetical protein
MEILIRSESNEKNIACPLQDKVSVDMLTPKKQTNCTP